MIHIRVLPKLRALSLVGSMPTQKCINLATTSSRLVQVNKVGS
ncbi:unnamed protein product [Rodentolepis nana]|uniref:Uncharacterized protein n=1 Tax=Rodentolepis nana TaxID=102285 RepID=A0A0R3TKE6_RODNA|nr:unnamed protein product [Rodentolepis nana]